MAEQRQIIRISISGESGFVPTEEKYRDKFTIDVTGAKYEYIPYLESESNGAFMWSVKATDSTFSEIFKSARDAMTAILKTPLNTDCCDMGAMDFSITFDDKKEIRKTLSAPTDEVKRLFNILKKVVPKGEKVPLVLTMADDFEE